MSSTPLFLVRGWRGLVCALALCGGLTSAACSDDAAPSTATTPGQDAGDDAADGGGSGGDDVDLDTAPNNTGTPDAGTDADPDTGDPDTGDPDTGDADLPDVPPAPATGDRVAPGASADTLTSPNYEVRVRVGGPAPNGRIESPTYRGTLSIGPPDALPPAQP